MEICSVEKKTLSSVFQRNKSFSAPGGGNLLMLLMLWYWYTYIHVHVPSAWDVPVNKTNTRVLKLMNSSLADERKFSQWIVSVSHIFATQPKFAQSIPQVVLFLWNNLCTIYAGSVKLLFLFDMRLCWLCTWESCFSFYAPVLVCRYLFTKLIFHTRILRLWFVFVLEDVSIIFAK